jgi:D-alanine--poly(phosphoribitol) ligase subunit 1
MENCFEKYFAANVDVYPERIAIEVQGRSYTYRELSNVANQIGVSINEASLNNEAIIVLNEHTLHSYSSIIAATFTGNAFLPIEQTWPIGRIREVIQTVKPAAIIYSEFNDNIESFISSIPELQQMTWIEASTRKVVRRPLVSNRYPGVAYILFTSGSTGKPKGVPVKRTNLNAFLNYHKKSFDFHFEDRFLQVYDITFDVAYFSFFVPLIFGACTCILNSNKNTPKSLCIIDDILNRGITVVSMVPTIINYARKFLRAQYSQSLRYSFFSGDVLYHSDAKEWKQFAPNSEIHNYYGLTETTIVCTGYVWKNIESTDLEYHNNLVPIGKPFPNTFYKIINEQDQELKDGIVGELALSGVQVVDHYVNNISPEKFIYLSDDSNSPIRFYKTGDRVSVNEFGNLVFHGRIDQQVKIDGYRIELEEVQLAIQKVTGRKNVVVKMQNSNGVSFLKAFVEGDAIDIKEVKRNIASEIPVYMIPAEMVFVLEMPLNENNKIDRLTLAKS